MTYEEVINYLYTQLPMFTRIGKAAYKANLDNTIALMDLLNHPYKEFKTIHVAGTNGKGSTSHFLASIFQESGYKTGLYTSPHLLDYRERIKINGIPIEKEFIINFVETYLHVFEEIKPSFFEWSVALCFNYFKFQKVDIAIIETGLGGRLDSTNIIQPLISVITNIGYDHKDLLGDTLEKIAYEKAGIIKLKTPVVIGSKHIETDKVFIDKSIIEQAPLSFAEDFYRLNNYILKDSNLLIEYNYNQEKVSIESQLNGLYQIQNIRTVLHTIDIINQTYEFHITNDHIIKGIRYAIENTGLMGRWQNISDQPLVICDTGHNDHGMQIIVEQLKELKRETIHFVIGMVADKDIGSVLKLLPSEQTIYYFCKADLPRAMNALELKSMAQTYQLTGNSYPDVVSAYKQALANCKEKEMVFVGGSTFVVADLLKFLETN